LFDQWSVFVGDFGAKLCRFCVSATSGMERRLAWRGLDSGGARLAFRRPQEGRTRPRSRNGDRWLRSCGPTSFIAVARGTPARSRFLTADRRKSCGTRPATPAVRHARSHAP